MNQDIKFYVISYPESYWLIPIYVKQFNKYVGDMKCVIMCYELPELDMELPDNVEIVSITNGEPQGGCDNWANSIRKYFETLDDEYVIFSLDDYLITDYLDVDHFNSDMEKVVDNDIKRYALGEICSLYDMVEWNGFKRFTRDSEYRISCQVSVWNRKFLMEFLQDGWNPWDFECTGSIESIGDDILVYAESPVLKYQYNGCISRRYNGRVNILGLSNEDIKELIQSEYGFGGRRLQYGTVNNSKLWFENVGYGFNINMLKKYMGNVRYMDYKRYYG